MCIHAVANAFDCGVPQKRERVFAIPVKVDADADCTRRKLQKWQASVVGWASDESRICRTMQQAVDDIGGIYYMLQWSRKQPTLRSSDGVMKTMRTNRFYIPTTYRWIAGKDVGEFIDATNHYQISCHSPAANSEYEQAVGVEVTLKRARPPGT